MRNCLSKSNAITLALLVTTSLATGTNPTFAQNNLAQNDLAASNAREIAVTADAVSFLPPDTTEVRIAVDSSAPTAQAAQALATEKLGVALENAKKAVPQGLVIADDGIKFSSASPTPNSSANQTGGAAGSSAASVTVSQMSVITVAGVDKAGPIVDALTKGTGARLISVKFAVKDRTAEKAQTSREAVERAKKKAEAAAAAAGLTLGPVVSINLVEESANKLVRMREEQGDGEQFTGGEDYQVIASVSFGIAK